jgi:hypothetical protein
VPACGPPVAVPMAFKAVPAPVLDALVDSLPFKAARLSALNFRVMPAATCWARAPVRTRAYPSTKSTAPMVSSPPAAASSASAAVAFPARRAAFPVMVRPLAPEARPSPTACKAAAAALSSAVNAANLEDTSLRPRESASGARRQGDWVPGTTPKARQEVPWAMGPSVLLRAPRLLKVAGLQIGRASPCRWASLHPAASCSIASSMAGMGDG